MARLSYKQLVDQVCSDLHLDSTPGSEDETTVKRSVNFAGRYIATAFDWPELMVETILTTVAPYSTSTATFTQNSTSVTGGATTWTGFAGRKMALSYNAPFYRISTVGGVASITLARAYLEATATNSTYVIYQDEYDTTTAVDSIRAANLLLTSSVGPMLAVSQSQIDSESTVQTTAGKPLAIGLCSATTTGTKRIRLTPVPDTVYAILLHYKTAWVNLEAPSATPVLDEDKDSLIISVAEVFAQRPADNRPITSYQQADELIALYWSKNKPHGPLTFRKKRMDQSGSRDWVYLQVAE